MTVIDGTRPRPSRLPAEHPGFGDPAYRERRAHIAEVGRAYEPGQPIPDVHYTAEEDDVWRNVSARAGREAPAPGLP